MKQDGAKREPIERQARILRVFKGFQASQVTHPNARGSPQLAYQLGRLTSKSNKSNITSTANLRSRGNPSNTHSSCRRALCGFRAQARIPPGHVQCLWCVGFVRYRLLDNIEKHIGAKVFMVDAEMGLNKLKQASTSKTQSSKTVCGSTQVG